MEMQKTRKVASMARFLPLDGTALQTYFRRLGLGPEAQERLQSGVCIFAGGRA